MAPWEGLRDYDAALEALTKLMDDAVKTVVVKTGAELVKQAQANFSGSHKRGQPHVGGDKPNIVSGDLRRSIKADPVTRFSIGDYGTTVAPTMIYGRRVELGFKGSRKYPYFEPAVRKVDMQKIAFEVWQAALN